MKRKMKKSGRGRGEEGGEGENKRYQKENGKLYSELQVNCVFVSILRSQQTDYEVMI